MRRAPLALPAATLSRGGLAPSPRRPKFCFRGDDQALVVVTWPGGGIKSYGTEAAGCPPGIVGGISCGQWRFGAEMSGLSDRADAAERLPASISDVQLYDVCATLPRAFTEQSRHPTRRRHVRLQRSLTSALEISRHPTVPSSLRPSFETVLTLSRPPLCSSGSLCPGSYFEFFVN